jgi:hypothetical protein
VKEVHPTSPLTRVTATIRILEPMTVIRPDTQT